MNISTLPDKRTICSLNDALLSVSFLYGLFACRKFVEGKTIWVKVNKLSPVMRVSLSYRLSTMWWLTSCWGLFLYACLLFCTDDSIVFVFTVPLEFELLCFCYLPSCFCPPPFCIFLKSCHLSAVIMKLENGPSVWFFHGDSFVLNCVWTLTCY